MRKTILAAVAACALGCLPNAVSAQTVKTFRGDHYSIGFASSWDSIQTGSVLGKYSGLQGMATLGAGPGSTLPNIDSLADFYADSLGGKIEKDSSGRLTIGKYDVRWQKFKYDSLPKLSAAVSAAVGIPVSLRNGEFRVYYLNADGVSFSIACMSVISGVKAPYGDVEKAIETLKLTASSGIIPLSRGAARDLWVKDGRLGGGWLKANRVFAVECYDTRGAYLGAAAHAAEGTWQLPNARSEMLVRLRTAQGNGMHILVRPQ